MNKNLFPYDFKKLKRALVITLFFLQPSFIFSQNLNASFTISSDKGCAPFSVNFTNTSSGAVSYYWNFGNGNFSNLRDPQNVFVDPGTYTVTLIVTAADGKKDTIIQKDLINAMPGPIASFASTDQIGCVGSTIFRFSNLSQGAVSYFWDFGDGTSSLDINPEKIYETTGPRTVKLKATNAGGCQTVYKLPVDIQIYPIPKPGFSSSILKTCNPSDAFNFKPEQLGASKYLWEFGDGTTSTESNPAKVFNYPGVFSVKLTLTNEGGCRDSLTREDYINVYKPQPPKIVASDSGGCFPFKPEFSSDITDAVTYAWDFGNGQKSSAKKFTPTYNTPGKYSVSLIVTLSSGCSYSSTENSFIEVFPNPVPLFTTGKISGCTPFQTSFTNSSLGASNYLWDFGDNTTSTEQNPSKIYLKAGSFTVKLKAISDKGCAATFQLSTKITAISPVASFSESQTSGCPPLKVEFKNNSSGGDSYLWKFSDGTISTGINPVKTFDSLGKYDVTLVATNSAGCKDSITKKDLISVSYDQASYTPPAPVKGCAPFTASFKNNDINAIDFLWDFGDGTTSDKKNPSHTYEKPGVYKVSLLVNQGTECKKIYPVFQEIIVEGGAPLFLVDIDPCPPHNVTFTDTTVGAVKWLWDFGDGTSSTEQNPSHIYANKNIYHVTLTTTTSGGCENKYIAFNAVNFARIMASFKSSYPPGPFPKTVKFYNTTPNATTWNWDFGDGTFSNEQNPSHVYQTEGEYKVILTVNSDSCEKKGEGTVVEEDEEKSTTEAPKDTISGGSFPPETYIREEPLSGCAPVKIIFFKQDTTHNILLWSFGDGQTSTEQLPEHVYSKPGLYSVFYVISTPDGKDTIQYPQSIFIGGKAPEFDVIQEDFCSHTTVKVAIQEHIYKKVSWSFGGGSSIIADTASHDFAISRSANNILLNVEDSIGCKSSHLKSIYTNPPIPEVLFPSTVCNDSVRFNQLISNPQGYSFKWDFGDGSYSEDFEPAHYYKTTGTYKIKLTVTDPKGCVFEQAFSQPVKFAVPAADYEFLSPKTGCAPLMVSMRYNGSDKASWLWNNAAGAEGNNVIFKGNNPGKYLVTLIVKSKLIEGCSTKVNIPDSIMVYSAKADFSFTQQNQCYPVVSNFTDLSQDAVSWSWDFGNGITSDQKNPTITFYKQPSDSFSLRITNSKGCKASIKKKGINIFRANVSAEYKGVCNPLWVKFKASPSENVTWEWHFGDNSSGSGSDVTHVFRENGSFNPCVIGKDKDGCRDTAFLSKPILVTRPKALFSSPTPASCAPSVVTFINQSVDAVSYKWDFGDGSFSTVKNPVKLYEKPGKYSVKLSVVSSSGCNDTLSLIDYVTVLGPATTFSYEKDELCAKTTIRFKDLSNGAKQWEWNFGEGHTEKIQHPVFSYDKPGSYSVTLFSKDSIGCSAFYTLKVPIVIHPYPKANFTLNTMRGCAPLDIATTNKSEGAIKYYWNFGGINSTLENNPTQTFKQPGEYTVELVAETDWKCRDTFRIGPVKALITPKAEFIVNQTAGCSPLLSLIHI